MDQIHTSIQVRSINLLNTAKPNNKPKYKKSPNNHIKMLKTENGTVVEASMLDYDDEEEVNKPN